MSTTDDTEHSEPSGAIDDTSQGELELDEPDVMRLKLGRRAPFTQVPDWVALAAISGQAKALYWLLSAHLNTVRGDRRAWPTQLSLAKMLGCSRGDKIKPLLDALVGIDAIEITKQRYKGGMRERSLYTIHETPPSDYDGPVSLSAWYDANREHLRSEPRRGKRKKRKPKAADDGQLAIDEPTAE